MLDRCLGDLDINCRVSPRRTPLGIETRTFISRDIQVLLRTERKLENDIDIYPRNTTASGACQSIQLAYTPWVRPYIIPFALGILIAGALILETLGIFLTTSLTLTFSSPPPANNPVLHILLFGNGNVENRS